MNLNESFRTAFFNLTANKLRSFLTMLGIIIGVAAVVTMTGLGQGMRSQVVGEISSLGSNLLTVIPGRARQGVGSFIRARGSASILKYRYFQELQEMYLPGIQAMTAEVNLFKTITASGENTSTQVVGTTPDYLEIRNFTLQSGRFFNNYDMLHTRKVAVLGNTVAQDLFGEPSQAVGKIIRIGKTNFTVIGVLEPKTTMGQDLGNQVIVPLSTHQQYLGGSHYLGSITIKTVSQEDLDTVAAMVEDFMVRKVGDPDAISILNQNDLIETVENITGTITLFLAAITGISLLVGGIGIMNIMLVSVVERTREIGLRKAIGAKPRDILFQFVIESSLLSIGGGSIGVVLGTLLGKVMVRFSQGTFSLSPGAVALALSISLAVGLFFGIYPARRASKLDPITALRYE